MAGRAEAGGGERVFLRIGLQRLDQLLHVVGRHLGVDAEDQRALRQFADGREILDCVELDGLLVQQRIDRMNGRVQVQRVAIGCRARDVGRADHAGSAGAVFHHHGLTQLLGELLGVDARHAVDRAAGRMRHHQRDRALRISLLRGGGGGRQGGGQRQGGNQGFEQRQRRAVGSGTGHGRISRARGAAGACGHAAPRGRAPGTRRHAGFDSSRRPRRRRPGSGGRDQAAFSWAELKPYLASSPSSRTMRRPLASASPSRPRSGRRRSPTGRPTAFISDLIATGLMAEYE